MTNNPMNQSQALQEANEVKDALNWALENCRVTPELQSDHFNILTNAYTSANRLVELLSSSGERGDGEVLYRMVSVSERLPEKSKWYSIILKNGDMASSFYYKTAEWKWKRKMTGEYSGDYYDSDITHWLEPITLPHPSTKEYSREQVQEAIEYTIDATNASESFTIDKIINSITAYSNNLNNH